MSLDFPYTTTKQLLTKVFNISLLGNETLSLAIPNKDITLIRPVFDQVDFLDFHKYEELVEIGYQAAKKQLSHS